MARAGKGRHVASQDTSFTGVTRALGERGGLGAHGREGARSTVNIAVKQSRLQTHSEGWNTTQQDLGMARPQKTEAQLE